MPLSDIFVRFKFRFLSFANLLSCATPASEIDVDSRSRYCKLTKPPIWQSSASDTGVSARASPVSDGKAKKILEPWAANPRFAEAEEIERRDAAQSDAAPRPSRGCCEALSDPSRRNLARFFENFIADRLARVELRAGDTPDTQGPQAIQGSERPH